NLKRCRAEALVEKALAEAEQEPGAHEARININVLGDVVCDEYLMGCALRLAIANALQFSQPGAQHMVQIRGGQSADGSWAFEIADNGVGLAREYWDKAFHMFWKLDRHRPAPSLGSGLAIVRRVLRRHGGEARFIDTGEGACLELKLPARS